MTEKQYNNWYLKKYGTLKDFDKIIDKYDGSYWNRRYINDDHIWYENLYDPSEIWPIEKFINFFKSKGILK